MNRLAPRLPVIMAVLAALPADRTLARSAPSPSALCETAAAEVARESGVPLRVLTAIMLTETGRQGDDGLLHPWAWAVNEGGKGRWFATAEAALDHVEAAVRAGVTNIDLGCFQLNWRWHGDAFGSAADMLDPQANAAHAARLLAGHHRQTGDWIAAAAAYHSMTPEHAARYRARFETIYAALDDSDAAAGGSVPAGVERPFNPYPLLQAGMAASPGSLVPLPAAARPLIGGS